MQICNLAVVKVSYLDYKRQSQTLIKFIRYNFLDFTVKQDSFNLNILLSLLFEGMIDGEINTLDQI